MEDGERVAVSILYPLFSILIFCRSPAQKISLTIPLDVRLMCGTVTALTSSDHKDVPR